MKTPYGALNNSLPHWHTVRSKRSSALVIVLACLVFISVLIVAFFGSVTMERKSAQFYANNSSVKLLADSTVSIVMGQITDATRGVDTSGNTLAWASQPGMIRNYNTQGQPAGYYKLYSSGSMVGISSFPGEAPSSTWMNSPALYTDLNDPITNSGAGFNIYPIVDPAATNFVQGFSLSGAPVSTTDAAPMPVQWLYVLRSGQVINPDTSSTTTATFNNAAVQPSPSNPIVGRIAFWTDDDTCKININTAAGDVWVNSSSPPALGSPGNPGSFWDTPRDFTQTETNYAGFQPANGEYQRYPGHPATTYLSAVFTNILTTPASIYSLTPRVSLGGSYSGTTFSTNSILSTDASSRLYASVDELLASTNTATAGSLTNRVVNNSSLTPQMLEKAKFFLTAYSRAPEVNLYNEPRVVIWPLASSTNSPPTSFVYRTAYDNLIAYCGSLAGTNNISGALNTNAYYFQRGVSSTFTNAYSPTLDLPATATATGLGRNRSLITYLRNLTSLPVPGFSTSNAQTFQAKYPHDRDQILTEIFDYIRAVNTQDNDYGTAGFNSYTADTYTAGEGQVVPITDTGTDYSSGTAIPLRGFGRMPIITEAALLFAGTGETGTLTNSATTNYYSTNYPPVASPGPLPAQITSPVSGNTRVQAALFLNLLDPGPAYGETLPNFRIKVTGWGAANGMTWSTNNGTAVLMGFPPTSFVKITSPGWIGWPTGDMGINQFVQATGYASQTSGFVTTNYLDVPSSPGGTFNYSGGTITAQILDAATGTTNYQTYTLTFPAGTFPAPQLAPYVYDTANNVAANFGNLTATNNMVGAVTNYGRFTTPAVNGMMLTYICSKDVVRSIALTTDPRMVAATTNVPASYYTKVEGYDSLTQMQAHGLVSCDNGAHRPYVGAYWGALVPNATYSSMTPPLMTNNGSPDFIYSGSYTNGVQPQVSSANSGPPYSGTYKGPGINAPYAFTASGGYAVPANGVTVGGTTVPGDWDNGTGPDSDGGYFNKVDEGSLPYNVTGLLVPYFGAGYKTNVATGSLLITTGASFSPNRQMPSAGMFGSLSTGINAGQPWQTLLFRPDPTGTSASPGAHPGTQSPPDYLFLDLFNMPVVEPYAISDPFSTAGKINMNYQIIPFSSYMTRSTGVQAVMRGEQILAVPQTTTTGHDNSQNYKAPYYVPTWRYYLDLNQTLTGFNNMFTYGSTDGQSTPGPDIFRSASQICSVWLVPAGLGQTYSTMQSFWQNTGKTGGTLTGDNSRERPYANIYPRLTTKSNTFTVHMRVQTLKMVKNADATETTWVEGADQITGDYRGSSTIERYLDTSSTSIPDYATLSQPITAGQAIDNFYKFRVVETKQFTP